MDWWTYYAKSLALKDKSEAMKIKCLFIAGARCQLLVVKMSLTAWANLFAQTLWCFPGKTQGQYVFLVVYALTVFDSL